MKYSRLGAADDGIRILRPPTCATHAEGLPVRRSGPGFKTGERQAGQAHEGDSGTPGHKTGTGATRDENVGAEGDHIKRVPDRRGCLGLDEADRAP
jgi:hypothetical protein